MNTHTTAGRGKKLCKGCEKYVGVRTKTCECGYVFPDKTAPKTRVVTAPTAQATETVPEPDDAPRNKFLTGFQVVRAPAGACPFTLKNDFTDEDVFDWARKVQEYGEAKKFHYTKDALLCWGRTLFDFQSDEYVRIEKIINENFIDEEA